MFVVNVLNITNWNRNSWHTAEVRVERLACPSKPDTARPANRLLLACNAITATDRRPSPSGAKQRASRAARTGLTTGRLRVQRYFLLSYRGRHLLLVIIFCYSPSSIIDTPLQLIKGCSRSSTGHQASVVSFRKRLSELHPAAQNCNVRCGI